MKRIIFYSIAFLLITTHVSYAQRNAKPVTSPKCNEFTFDATNSHDPDNEDLAFLWDFGDRHVSSEPVVTHIYNNGGDYLVTLTVTDSSGFENSTSKTTQTVRVNIPPFASFVGPDQVCSNQPLTFDAAASHDDKNNPLSYSWDFGDRTTSSGKARVTKTFKKSGRYKVVLTVDDNSDATCSQQTAELNVWVNESPVADAGKDEILKCVSDDDELVVNFDASNSSDTNNEPLVYQWDFGDGQFGEGMKASHRYTRIGKYDAKLIVRDKTEFGCGTNVDFITVRLNKAPKANAGEDVTACADETVTFDGSKSYAHTKGTLLAKWTFGDGDTANGLTVNHRYKTPGKYQANLTVENELNIMCPPSQDTRSVTINTIPTVTMKANSSACVGEEIQFDATSAADPDGDSLEYYWTFGDGTILSSGPKVSHTYSQGGTYRASIIVDDGKGSACSTATSVITIKVNSPPVADAGPNLTCCVGKPTAFDASATTDPDGDDLIYNWDFGDGQQTEGLKTNHTYAKSGSYNVILTVDDNTDSACSKSTTGYIAEINAPPVAIINIR